MIALLSGLGVLVVLVGLGVWVRLYQVSLNKQRVKDRVAATELQKLTIGYDTISSGFYPNIPFEYVTYEYNEHFYEALTSVDNSYHLQPSLATSWENPSDTVWRFRLAKNVKFHDGSVMTAADVKASIEMAMANENTSGMLPGLASVNIVDASTIDLVTSSPSPLLANALATVFILPEKLIKAADYTHPVGTGPFEYVSSDDTSVTLKRFEDYHGVKPKEATVVLKSYEDYSTRVAALRNHEVDVIQTVEDPSTLGKDKDGQSLQMAASPGIGVYFLSLDGTSDSITNFTGVTANPFKDIRVRQALQKALDLNQLIKDSNTNNAVPAAETVAPAIFGFDPSIKVSAQNVTDAKALMVAAGYQNGFTVKIDIAKEATRPVAEALKTQLAAIGINLDISMGAGGGNEFMQKVGSGDSSMFILEYDCATGDALEAYQILFGSHAFFTKAYSDTAMNDLMTQAEGTFDLAKRKEDLQQLAKMADQAKTMIPLLVIKPTFAYHQGIELATRYDGNMTAKDIKGAIPTSIQSDYTYLGTLKKIFGIKA